MDVLKAIETRYAGCRFRSRLEARWAVFFDFLNIKWEYEKEGFELPSGRYLPDFWLPMLNCWLEIKPKEPSATEARLCEELAEKGKYDVHCFCGLPPGYGTIGSFVYHGIGRGDQYHAFCVCLACGSIGIAFEGRSERLPCKCCEGYHGEKTYDDPRILAATKRARSARFEFGESG
jgi:hypothetical protein